MKIKFKVHYKEYRGLLFRLAYNKPVLKFLLCVGLAMLIWILVYHLDLFPVRRPGIFQYITLGLIAVFQPIAILRTIKQNYWSSNQLAEHLEVEFTATQIKIVGESFYTEIAWEKTLKVVERARFILIYQNTLSAIILPKTAFDDEQMHEFRKLVSTLKEVPVHLKKPQ